MLFYQSLATYFHFIGIFILIICLVLEYVLFQKNLNNTTAKIISKADMWYGISSGIIAITGLLKMFYLGKGAHFYMYNSIFWTKITLFTLVGLFSIFPTIRFLKWRQKIKAGESIQLSDTAYNKTKKIILAELILFVFIPLCATLMARGFGYFG